MPQPEHYPKLIAFLGRELWPEPRSFPDQIKAARLRRGLTIDQSAEGLGVESSTWWWWEQGRRPHLLAQRERLAEFVGEESGKPQPVFIPAATATDTPPIGQLLVHRRKEASITQADAASRIGVDAATLLSWEQGKRQPSERFYPSLIRYLGREPWPEPSTLGERLRAERLRRGLSFEQMAGLIRVDRGSIAKWESGAAPKHKLSREKVEAFLEGRPTPSMRGRKAARLAAK